MQTPNAALVAAKVGSSIIIEKNHPIHFDGVGVPHVGEFGTVDGRLAQPSLSHAVIDTCRGGAVGCPGLCARLSDVIVCRRSLVEPQGT